MVGPEFARNEAAWGPSEFIAFGLLAVTVLGMLAGGVVAIARFSHRMGRHDERLENAERQIKDLRAADRSADIDRQELAVLRAVMERIEHGLRDLGSDLGRRMEHLESDVRRFMSRQ